MQISKERPAKFEHPVGLVYYARLITEAERNEPYVEPTLGEYEMLCGYEPTKAPRTFERYLAASRVGHEQKIATRKACKYTIEKYAVERSNWDDALASLEQNPEFQGYLHYESAHRQWFASLWDLLSRSLGLKCTLPRVRIGPLLGLPRAPRGVL